MFPTQRRQMRQQLLVDLHPFTLQGIDRSFHIDSIPQRDSSLQERLSTGAIALIFRFSIPDFSQSVQEYRTRQRVTGFSFIQSRLYPPTKCGSRNQSSINSVRSIRPISLNALASPFCLGQKIQQSRWKSPENSTRLTYTVPGFSLFIL